MADRSRALEDRDVRKHIETLVGEEQRLFADADSGGLSADAQARLSEIQVQLDRYWDLLRQRRARRNAGLDPNTSALRPADVVERYRQ